MRKQGKRPLGKCWIPEETKSEVIKVKLSEAEYDRLCAEVRFRNRPGLPPETISDVCRRELDPLLFSLNFSDDPGVEQFLEKLQDLGREYCPHLPGGLVLHLHLMSLNGEFLAEVLIKELEKAERQTRRIKNLPKEVSFRASPWVVDGLKRIAARAGLKRTHKEQGHHRLARLWLAYCLAPATATLATKAAA